MERSLQVRCRSSVCESDSGWIVGPELAAVQSIYGGKVLLDAEFDVASVTAELASREPSILHIASHGVFSGDPATSFLLAYDEKINMNQLSEIVGTTRFRDQPLELLVLSVCETATGDERSALGLAGIATLRIAPSGERGDRFRRRADRIRPGWNRRTAKSFSFMLGCPIHCASGVAAAK